MPTRSQRCLIAFGILGGVALASGCSTVSFLWQAARGQLKLSSRARPLEEAARDPRVDPQTQMILQSVRGIKKFAERQGLKRTRNYEHYVKWDDDALVWVVSATPELSLENKIWHFPIVGDVPYLGFFERARAEEFERNLQKEGWETDVRGAAAYSSLGYFQDPLVSTLWRSGDPDALATVAQTVLHESVHATLYLPSQSSLNESIAEFISQQLTPLYLEEVGKSELRARWEERGKRWVKLAELMNGVFADLEQVYRDEKLNAADKRASKDKILGTLNRQLEERGVRFPRPINNPVIAQYRTYHDATPQWHRLWELCGRSPQRLLERVRTFLQSHGDPGDSTASDRLSRWLGDLRDCQ